MLEDIKRQVLEQLGGLPGSLYGPIEEAMKAESLKGDGRNYQYEDQAALWILRQHQASHVMAFRQYVAQAFDHFRNPNLPEAGVDIGGLSLVDENQLSFDLAGERLTEVLDQRYQRPLDAIRARFKLLSEVIGVPMAENPVGPRCLVAAFTRTYVDAQVPESLRVRLFRQYEQELSRLLGELYARINTLLTVGGYGNVGEGGGASVKGPPPGATPIGDEWLERVPEHKPQAPLLPNAAALGGLQDAALAAALGAAAGQGAMEKAAMPVSQVDVALMAAELAELRAQLHAWRDGLLSSAVKPGAGASSRASLGPRRELRVDEVMGVASLLQPESTDAFARALSVSGRLGDTIRDHLYDGARRLGLNPEQTCFSAEEDDAIDLVALLFDSLFRHHALQERARRVFGGLVMPYVKVALTDSAVFVKREHPARRLLDAITEACEGNDGETPHDRALLDRAASISQRIIAEYNEDLAVFELAHAELDALLAQQRRRVELQEQRSAKATYGRERLSTARSQADTALREWLGEHALTQAVADFLAMPWRHHMVQVLLREGDEARRRSQALALGEALIRADRLASENRGRELANHLIALQPAIGQCLASSGMDSGAADHGMAGLVRALATPDVERRVRPVPAPTDQEDDSEERKLYLVGGTATVPHDPLLADRMRSLEPGDWLRLTNGQGETSSVKVAWISPLTSRLLLVNRRGLRVLVAAAEELAVLAANGRLLVGAERTAFDEAMRQVRKHLDRVM